MSDELLEKFDKDFREYINACIRYAELQKSYRPLDFEEEVAWIKNLFKVNCK